MMFVGLPRRSSNHADERRRDLPVRRWRGFPPSRRVYAVAAGGLVIAILAFTAAAQSPRRAAQPLQLAQRALVEGRYDAVDQAVDKLDARDPAVVALKARAAIARGRYADAEAALRPVATRAPTSDAALELGLLQQMLGRPDAAATLEKVAASGESADEAADLARAARAMRALGRFHEANAAYRDAAAAAPADLAVNTAWGELFLEKYQNGEAVVLTRGALTLRPNDPRALGDLGIHLLRTGDEPAARSALDASFKIDPFDVVTYNLLEMMDKLDKFVTIRDGDVVVRMQKDDA